MEGDELRRFMSFVSSKSPDILVDEHGRYFVWDGEI